MLKEADFKEVSFVISTVGALLSDDRPDRFKGDDMKVKGVESHPAKWMESLTSRRNQKNHKAAWGIFDAERMVPSTKRRQVTRF
jgi:hypothetical protein